MKTKYVRTDKLMELLKISVEELQDKKWLISSVDSSNNKSYRDIVRASNKRQAVLKYADIDILRSANNLADYDYNQYDANPDNY